MGLLSPENEEKLLTTLERVRPVNELLAELEADQDREFAELVKRHNEFTRDRLLLSDMRDMSANIGEESEAKLNRNHRKLLKEALIDQDLARRLNETQRAENNAAWQEFIERYRRLLWHLVNHNPNTSYLPEARKEEMVQDIFMEMLQAIKPFDARQAKLSTYISVVASRVCYRSRDVYEWQGLDDNDDMPAEGDDYRRVEAKWALESLFEKATKNRGLNENSIQIYKRILRLKVLSWKSQDIAESINRDLNPDEPFEDNTVNQRWHQLKAWMRQARQQEEQWEQTNNDAI